MASAVQEGAAAARALLNRGQRELAELFASLEPVTAAEIAGAWTGSMAGVAGLGRLPRPVRKLVHGGVSTRVGPWQGKRFDANGGMNIWGTSTRHTDWMQFRSELLQRSPVGGQPSFWLDYDIAENPRALRRIRGEIRRLDSAAVLGRMTWQTRKGLRTLLFFPMYKSG